MNEQTKQLKWRRLYNNHSYECEYVDSEGRFLIQKFENHERETMWMIYRQEDWQVLDCTFSLRDAKAYCETEV